MSAVLSQPPDLINMTNELANVTGKGIFDGHMETFSRMLTTHGDQAKDIISSLGTLGDGFNMSNFNRFDVGDNLNAKWNGLVQKGFDYTGMTALTDKMKGAFSYALNAHIGESFTKSFDDLPLGTKEVLRQYGNIDASRWEILKQTQTEKVGDEIHFNLDRIRDIPDIAFMGQMSEKVRLAKKDLPFKEWDAMFTREAKDLKKQLEVDMRTFFVEETRNAVLEPDVKTQRHATGGGLRAGTPVGEAMRMITQFKSFPMTYFNRTVKGQRWRGQGEQALGGGLAHHAAASILMGYVSMAAKDFVKGKAPRDVELKTIPAAIVQSGGLGIFGDLLFGEQNRMGGGMWETVLGPSAGTISKTVGIAAEAVQSGFSDDVEFDVGSDIISLIQSNTPFAGSAWYLKAPLDYAVWYHLREAASPGSIRRMERNVKKKQGQTYFYSPTQAVR